MKRFPDEVLDYYGQLFIEQRIRELGVTFERFLDFPEIYLKNSRSPGRHPSLLTGLLLVAMGLLAACGGAKEADRIADGFIDHYYVKPDLARAKSLTDGLAARKIEQEQALLQGGNGRMVTGQREVVYRLLERTKKGDQIFFIYALDIKGQGVPTLKKQSLLSVTKVGDVWRITNFQDFDS